MQGNRHKIFVVGDFQADCSKAHAINTVGMANGFASLGYEVSVFSLSAQGQRMTPQALSEKFQISPRIKWIQIPQRAGTNWTYASAVMAAAVVKRPRLIYARCYTVPWLTSRLGIPTVGESHAPPGNQTKSFLRYVKASHHHAFGAWVTISPYLAEHYASLGVPKGKLLVFADAVNLELFERPDPLPESPYPASSRPRVVYAGHLYDYKGIPTFLEAAGLLPDVEFHLVGGLPDDLQRQQQRAGEGGLKNVVFHGLVAHKAVPPYLWHADILLLAPSAEHPSAQWTSPVKAGEYFASGVPVLASDIPALRNWMSDNEVFFVAPDSPRALADGIQQLLQSPGMGRDLAEAARQTAQNLSYERRAQRILDHHTVRSIMNPVD